MKMYISVMKASWQKALTYKTDFIVSSLLNVLRIIAEVVFWTAFFQISNKGSINGYTLPMMTTYYIIMFVVSTLVNMGDVGMNTANDIKSGNLTQYILKPLNYKLYYFSEMLSRRILEVMVALLVFIPVFYAGYAKLQFGVNTGKLAFLPLVVFLAMVLNFMLNVFIGYLAFWFTELTSFFFLKDVLLGFVSGAVIPVDLFPAAVQNIMNVLPFMYLVYFPVKTLISVPSYYELFTGIGMQLAWIAVFYVSIRLLWRFGIRLYSGTGM